MQFYTNKVLLANFFCKNILKSLYKKTIKILKTKSYLQINFLAIDFLIHFVYIIY